MSSRAPAPGVCRAKTTNRATGLTGQVASANGYDSTARVLHDHGDAVNQANERGETPLYVARDRRAAQDVARVEQSSVPAQRPGEEAPRLLRQGTRKCSPGGAVRPVKDLLGECPPIPTPPPLRRTSNATAPVPVRSTCSHVNYGVVDADRSAERLRRPQLVGEVRRRAPQRLRFREASGGRGLRWPVARCPDSA